MHIYNMCGILYILSPENSKSAIEQIADIVRTLTSVAMSQTKQ